MVDLGVSGHARVREDETVLGGKLSRQGGSLFEQLATPEINVRVTPNRFLASVQRVSDAGSA
jgi:hypothetical protein